MAVIGIDLGERNTVCACTVAGVAKVLANRERGTLTPSVVARHKDGSLLVGTTAVRTAKSDPLNVIFSIKRLMGRRYNDKEVEIVQKHVSYRIVPPKDGGTGMAHVMIGDKLYSPIEVSALILEKIKKDAELALGDAVTHAVITVPAYFDDNQREATRQAGGLAGLKVKRIIDEPTAAAYAFGVDLDTSAAKAIVVYDLGGGTFDISVIFIGAGVPTVESIDGDIWLGGDKFDNYIIDFVLKKYPAHSADLRKDAGFMLDLKQQSEQAKKDLAGGAPSTEISIAAALRGRVDVEVEIRNEEFERMIEEDIAGSLVKVDDALRGANMSVAEIDHVLLVGGSTGLPLVQRLLAKKFGAEKVRATVNPMECVALGAAILASRSEKKFCPKRNCGHENEPDAAKCVGCEAPLAEVEAQVKCPHCNELHAKYEVVCPTTGKSLVGAPESVTAKPIGIGVEGDRFEIVVPKGTRYPATEPISVEFKTVSDFQDWIIIPIYQGSEPTATRNELQGEIVIPENGPIPQDKRVPKGAAVDVGFQINEAGTLTIQVSGKGDLKWLKTGKLVRPWEDSRRYSMTQSSAHSDPPRTQLLAVCLLNAGRADEAVKFLTGGGKLENSNLQFSLALAYARQGKVDEAVITFLQILDRDPQNETVRCAAVALLHRHAVRSINKRDTAAAAGALGDALKLDPQNPQLRALLSRIENVIPIVQLRSNKRREAVEAWEKAQRIQPENGRLAHSLALACSFWASSLEEERRGAQAGQPWRKAIMNWVLTRYSDSFWAEWAGERGSVYSISDGSIEKLRESWGEQLSRKLKALAAAYDSHGGKKDADRCRALELSWWLEDATACVLAELKKVQCPACRQIVRAAAAPGGAVCAAAGCGKPLRGFPAHTVPAAGPLGLEQFGMASQAAQLVKRAPSLPNGSALSGALERLRLPFIKTNADVLKYCLSSSPTAFALVANRRFEEALALMP